MELVKSKVGFSKVTLITAEGVNVGEVTIDEAVEKAEEADLDLVRVSDGKVPVCKVADFNKWRYEQQKKEKAKRQVNKVKLKETQLSVNIGEHDLNVKARKAKDHLENGDKVKVVLKMKGRQNSYGDLGSEVVYRFIEVLKESIDYDLSVSDVVREGNRITALVE